MNLARTGAGATLIAASLGLSAISGMMSYTGLTMLLPEIPFIGWLGFVIAVSLVALSVGLSAEIARTQWPAVALLAALVAGTAALDSVTNHQALQSQVTRAEQDVADRNARYEEAAKALPGTREEIAELERRLGLMVSQDVDEIREAQLILTGLGTYAGKIDGLRGPQTLAAMGEYGGELRKRLATLRETEGQLSGIVADGATVAEAPFGGDQAVLYAIAITALSLLLSFAGGYLATPPRVEEIQEAVNDLTEDVCKVSKVVSLTEELLRRSA